MKSTHTFPNRSLSRRLLSTFLSLAMVLSLLPVWELTALADNGIPAYRRESPEVAVLNAYSGSSEKLYSAIKGDGAYAAYNGIGLYTRQSTGQPAKYSDRATGNEQAWNFSLNSTPVLKELAKVSNNLQFNTSATFYNRTHTHSHYSWKEVKTYTAEMTVTEKVYATFGGSARVIDGWSDKSRTYPRIGDLGGVQSNNSDGFNTIYYKEGNDYCSLQFSHRTFAWKDFEYRTCTCGGSYAENFVVAFRDTRAPELADIKYSADGTNYARRFNGMSVGKGKSVYIKLTFDEPIRFADDSAAGKGDLYLDLQADGETAGKYRANLIELSGCDLIFKYTVPNNQETDVRIVALGMDALFASNATLPLKQVNKGGSFSIAEDIKVNGSTLGLSTTTCYITDLAGNAPRKQTILDANLTLDSGAPYVAKVAFELTCNNTDVKEALGKAGKGPGTADYDEKSYTDASDLFLGVGDSFYLIVHMNERLKGIERSSPGSSSWQNAFFVTNLLDADNKSVEVSSRYLYPFYDYSTEATQFVTGNITIGDGYYLPAGETEIKVTRMYFTNGNGITLEEITDRAGNALNKDNVTIADNANANPPKLDTVAPMAEEIAGSYAPEDNGFRYGVTLSDAASGYAGIYGSFILNNNGDKKAYQYEWAVKADATSEVAEKDWQAGTTGTAQQLLQTQNIYFYIRPKAGETYVDFSGCTITVRAKDFAGNESNVKLPAGGLAWYIDNLAPTAAAGSTTRALNSGGTGGTLTAEVILTDGRGISSWQYAWSNSGDSAPASWMDGSLSDTTSASVTVTAKGDVTKGKLFSQYLWVKATDNSVNKNESAPVCLGQYSYDLRDADYALEYSRSFTELASISAPELDSEDTLFFLVPAAEGSEYYAVYQMVSKGGNNIFRQPIAVDASTSSGWKFYQVTLDVEGNYTLTSDPNRRAESLLKTLQPGASSFYSGNLSITVLAGKKTAYAANADGVITLGNASNKFVEDTITLRLTGYANDLFGKISLTCNDDLGNVHYNSAWSTAEGYQRTTLAGLRFTVSIDGDNRDWRYENVDWQQSYIRLENKSTGSRYDIPIGPFQIPESDPNGAVSQTVTVPEDSYESGVYIATFHLALKAGRNDYDAWLPNGSTYRQIAVDTVQPNSDFSLSSVIYDPQAKYDYLRTAYGLNQSYGEGGKLELASDSGIIYLPISKSQVDPTYARIAAAPEYYVTVTSPAEAGWRSVGTNSSSTAYVGCYAVQLWNTAHAGNKVELTTAGDPTKVTTNGNTNNSLSFVFSTEQQDSTHLYLTPGQINTVAVQKVYDNGRRSDIKYYQIMPVEEAIGGSIRLDKDAKQLVFTPETGASTAGATVFAWAWQNDQDELKGEGQRIEMNAYADGTWRCALQENGANYAVITVSAHGALCEVGSLGQRAPWFDDGPGAYNKDNGISGLEFKDNSNGGTYTLKFRVRDDQGTMKDGLTVDIGFNEAYSKNTFTLTYDGTNVTWTTNDGHPTGIYSATAVKNAYFASYGLYSRDYLDVTVEGVFAKVPDGTTMDITVTATDAFGNAGSVSSTGHPVNYVEPKVIERKTLLGMTFNQPVRPVESWAWHEKDGNGFKTEWSQAFPISGNGTWSIQYRDAFGQIHAEEITINDFTENGKDYSLDLAFSTTELTAEAVTMTTNAANGTVKVYKINGNTHTEMTPVGGFPGIGTQKRQTPINENMETEVEVNDGDGYTIYRLRVYIDNIVSGAPEADVRYYVEQLGQEFTQSELDAYAANGVTVTGNIRAWYNTARHVTPTGNTGSAFLFTPGGAASHTFTYADDLGNAGSVTAALPAGLTLQAPTQPPEDTTAPTVDVDIYFKRAGSYTRAEAFLATDNQADIDSKFGNLGYVQGYNLAVNAVDASGFTIAVTGDGAALNGNTVTITKAGTYTVTVTDKSPRANKTEFTFTVPDRIDTTPPTATVAVSAKSLYEKTITLTLEDRDNNGNLISIQELDTVTLNAPADAKHTDRNTYKYNVADNGDIQFLFRDIAGNTGSTTQTISGIDTAPPELTVRWSPSDEKDAAFPPAGPISSNITAHIDSNKAMQNLTVRAGNEATEHPLLTNGAATSYTIPGQSGDLVTITAMPERVTVTFKEKYDQTLTFTATTPNGKSTAVTLNGITAIDKVAPTVTQLVETRYDRAGNKVGDTAAAYQVVVAITPSKSVTSVNYGGTEVYQGQRMPVIYHQNYPLEITFTRDGIYTVLLNDQAGNTTAVPVTITGIDRTAPTLTVTTVEENNRVKATVTVNEPCTVTWGENGRHIFGAAGSHEITFTQNGTFAITAVDAAGNESFKMVTVGSIDNDPPSISFDNGTIYVTEGTTAAELKAELDKGYTVWDKNDVTPADKLTVTYDSSTVVLTAAGQYAVTYTVLDKAGNQTTASRFVRVIGADTVCVSIDGQLILPDSTAVLRPGEHTLTLQNSAQPYSIKARRGILSAGQMKYLSGSSLHFDADGKFTVSSTGYYTLLVTTQDRQTIRVLLYVEQ